MNHHRRKRQKLPEEAISLSISRLGHDGRGIASIEGKVAFVEGALPGERVLAQFTGRKRQFDELKAVEILEASENRVTPPCAFAGVCGGCAMQHIASDAQVALKETVLLDHLAHMGGISGVSVLPALRSPTEGYRRKARLAIRYVSKKDSMLVGFREKGSSFITDMTHCEVLNPAVSALIAPLREFLSGLEGRLALPQIELAVGEASQPGPDGIHPASQVAFIVRHLEVLSDADSKALIAFAREHEIALYLQPKGADSVHKVWPAEGEERLAYYLPEFGLRLAFHPADFTQVNGELNRAMISRAMALLDPQADDVVLDLFCGLGNFTLPIATRAGEVVGVEGSQEMVERGAENARANGLHNARFFSADLTVDFDENTWGAPRYTKILLDPPRSGALEIIPQVAAFRARKIVYISCNPATLARDAGELVKLGYEMVQTGIMDMFPHTGHVESIAEFVLKKP